MKSPKGRLELTWMGKDLALLPSEQGKYDYEWVDRSDPRVCELRSIEVMETVGDTRGDNGADQNLLITGESGDVLRALGAIPEWVERYLGKVKLVYIDPPFNTDQAFEHYADALEHSVWLTMMRDRIRDIKPLLSEDGSIWVHLDDAEVHRMRCVLDEELGAENFVAEVVWQKADSTRNDAKGLSVDQDFLLVYRATSAWSPNRLPRTAESDARFSSPDGDPSPWFDDNPSAPGAKSHQGMVYAIQHPITGQLIYPARGRCWWTEQAIVLREMSEYAHYELRDIDDADERAQLCGVSSTAIRKDVRAVMLAVPLKEAQIQAQARYDRGHWPAIILRSGGRGGFGRKSYVPSVGLAVPTWWSNDKVGHNREAKAEIKSLFPASNPFDTPKPERLLQRIIHTATNPGDIVLDCFAGSGTTAAVAHKMGRRWVAVELQQSNVDRFIRPRLTKVVRGDDPGGITSDTERVPVVDLPDGVSPKEARDFARLVGKFTDGQELRIDVLGESMKAIRRLSKDGGGPLTDDETRTLLSMLRRFGTSDASDRAVDVMPEVRRQLRAAAQTKNETTTLWHGGGGFAVAAVGPSMYEVDDDGSVYLSASATNGAFSKAIAGQMRYRLVSDHPVFCGFRGRSKLAVIDGVADETVVRTVVEHLGEGERAVIVAKSFLPEAANMLKLISLGSRLRKAPDDIFPKATVK